MNLFRENKKCYTGFVAALVLLVGSTAQVESVLGVTGELRNIRDHSHGQPSFLGYSERADPEKKELPDDSANAAREEKKSAVEAASAGDEVLQEQQPSASESHEAKGSKGGSSAAETSLEQKDADKGGDKASKGPSSSIDDDIEDDEEDFQMLKELEQSVKLAAMATGEEGDSAVEVQAVESHEETEESTKKSDGDVTESEEEDSSGSEEADSSDTISKEEASEEESGESDESRDEEKTSDETADEDSSSTEEHAKEPSSSSEEDSASESHSQAIQRTEGESESTAREDANAEAAMRRLHHGVSCKITYPGRYDTAPQITVESAEDLQQLMTAVFVDEDDEYRLLGLQLQVKVPSVFELGGGPTQGEYVDIDPRAGSGKHKYSLILLKDAEQLGPRIESIIGTPAANDARTMGSTEEILEDFETKGSAKPKEVCRCSIELSAEDIEAATAD